MKFLILGGTGNLSSIATRKLLEEGHTVHCVTRGSNRMLEAELETLGAIFLHSAGTNKLLTDGWIQPEIRYDFVLDFIAYTPEHAANRVKCLYRNVRLGYVYISTTAFYRRSMSRSSPLREDTVEISRSWDYASDKYDAELVFKRASQSADFKTLVIRLGHTIGTSIPVYLGNPGRAFIDHISIGAPIPFIGSLDQRWSVGSAAGLSRILCMLPTVAESLPNYYTFHYSEVETTWRILYEDLCECLGINNPGYALLEISDVIKHTPEWLPSIVNHKIYEDRYCLERMKQYFGDKQGKQLKEIIGYACTSTLSGKSEESYEFNRQKLELLVNESRRH